MNPEDLHPKIALKINGKQYIGFYLVDSDDIVLISASDSPEARIRESGYVDGHLDFGRDMDPATIVELGFG